MIPDHVERIVAAQQPAGENGIGHDAQPMTLTEGIQVPFIDTLKEIVEILRHDQRRVSVPVGDPQRLDQRAKPNG